MCFSEKSCNLKNYLSYAEFFTENMLSISIIAGLIPMVCWGFADFLQSTVIRKLGVYKTIFLSNVMVLLMTIPFAFFSDLSVAYSNLFILFFGGITQTFSIFFFYESMRKGEISIVLPISASYPIITVLLLWSLLGNTIGFVTGLSILILILGVMLISTDLKKLKHLHTVAGVRESVYTLLLWGFYFFVLEVASKKTLLFGIDFPEMTFMSLFIYSYIFTSIFMLVFSIIKKGVLTKKDLKKNKKIVFREIYIQIIYLVSWLVLNYGFILGRAELIAPISSLYPAIAVILAIIFYKEKLVFNQKIGILTILLGLFLISM